jgi:dephospho-CoA kinase
MDSKRKGRKRPSHKKDEKRDFQRRVLLSPKAGSVIAITGGIATGKTFVLECFKKLGFEVFNVDTAIHDLMKRSGKAFNALAELFPNAVKEDGIDRKVLSGEIAAYPEKLKSLEQILHPLVRDAQVEFLIQLKKTSGKSAIFEVPLLFENKRESSYDYIVVTHAPLEVQKQRALARPNMTEEKLKVLMDRQLPQNLKLKKAHIVINTGKGFEDTLKQIKAVIRDDNFKRNRTRHGVDRPLRQKR